MKLLNLKLILLVLLICLAFASAAYALKPLIFRVEKQAEIEQAVEAFEEAREKIYSPQTASETPASVEPAESAELPYVELLRDMSYYNARIYVNRQEGLNSRSAYAISHFDLCSYGLSSEVFGVIRIPAMDLEMPLYLGASDANMANGAAVLAQTSIPIGGESTNAVIAGHRGWNGYKYFMDIELLQLGDEVTITNLWETLTYEVVEIKIVSPDDVDAILIQPGKDMITLLTCHPPNSGGRYRYLVFCERVSEG